MNEFNASILSVLTGKDGPLFWGLTLITILTLGWKFFDSGYRAEGERWKVYQFGQSRDIEEVTDEITDHSN